MAAHGERLQSAIAAEGLPAAWASHLTVFSVAPTGSVSGAGAMALPLSKLPTASSSAALCLCSNARQRVQFLLAVDRGQRWMGQRDWR